MSTELMNKQDNTDLKIEEPLAVQIQNSSSTKKSTIFLWFQRLFMLNETADQKHHRPIFIVIMSIIHVVIYFSISTDIYPIPLHFTVKLFNLGKFYLPCMQPASQEVRTRSIPCSPWLNNKKCYYDIVLQRTCTSFLYPHQLWRFFTVNFFHLTWLHLLCNLSIQLIQGIPLERKYGSIRVGIIYWISGLGASAIFIIRNQEVSGYGASGSLYGLMLFLVVDRLVTMRKNTVHRRFHIVQLLFLLLPHIIISIPFIIKYYVGHSAHIGGGLVGFLLGIGMLGCPWPWNHQLCIDQMACRRIAIVLLVLFFFLIFTLFFSLDAPLANSVLLK